MLGVQVLQLEKGALEQIAACCHLRWRVLAALRAGRVDLLCRRLVVAESVIELGGQLTWSTPKNYQQRSVPVPGFLAGPLSSSWRGRARGPRIQRAHRSASAESPLAPGRARPGADEGGLAGLTLRELRYTAASLAVSLGANVKAVQRVLGHASAAMTLDVYSGLFDDGLGGLAERMDAAAADVYPMCTGAEVVALPFPANHKLTRRDE